MKHNWFSKIWNEYPHCLVLMIAIQYLNEGLLVMKQLAIKDLFRDYYYLEPSVS